MIGCGKNSFAFTGLEEEEVIGQRVEQVLGLQLRQRRRPGRRRCSSGACARSRCRCRSAANATSPASAKADMFPAYDDDGGLLLVLTPDK